MDIGALATQFYNDHNGQSLSFDGVRENIGQCVQAAEVYMRDYLHVPVKVLPGAKDYGNTLPGLSFVTNNPNDPNQVPPRGAIIVWNGSLPGSGGYGHIAVFWQNNAGAHTFVSIDSNWGGKTLHQVTHNWQYVQGWLVPSAPAVIEARAAVTVAPQPQVNQGDEMIETDFQAHQAYQTLRPNGDGNADEITNTVGKRTYAQWLNDATPERQQRDAAITTQASLLSNQSTTINQLNATITELNVKGVNDDKKLQDALNQISSISAQLTTQHDQIVQQQNLVSNIKTAAQNVSTAVVKMNLWQKLLVWYAQKQLNKK